MPLFTESSTVQPEGSLSASVKLKESEVSNFSVMSTLPLAIFGFTHSSALSLPAVDCTAFSSKSWVPVRVVVVLVPAGGVVVLQGEDGPRIVIGRRRRERVGVTWSLPKGTPIPGETTEETALREVTEETGLLVRIVAPIGSIGYEFVQGGTRIEKTVHYYLMEATGGSFENFDHEFEELRWVPMDEAVRLLDFKTESALVERVYAQIGG